MSELSIPLKRCKICQRELPLTVEYFHPHKTTRDRFRPECRECNKASQKAKYWSDPEAHRQAKRDEYWEDPQKFRGRTAKFKEKHPDYYYEYEKEYRVNNRDKIRAKHRNWSAENPMRIRGYYHKRYNKDPESYRARGRATYHKNKAPYIINGRKRQMREIVAEGVFTSTDLDAIYTAQCGCCVYCGREIDRTIPRSVHIDHIIPLSRGGSNWPQNLALTCPRCNLSKGNKLLSEWQALRGW